MNLNNWTGERLETFVNTEVAVEHLHRYAIVLGLAKGKRVLDIASGEGYGSNLIAGVADEVVGVDISEDAIYRAQSKYKKGNLRFLEGSASSIPLSDNYFDVVVSFETIEHHDKHHEMMSEIKRVLKPEGLLIISSPDKLHYTDKRQFFNKFHVKELYAQEFKDLVRKNFTNSNFYNQRATFASLLIPNEENYAFKEYRGNYDRITEINEFEQLYILAVAADVPLPDIQLSAFTDDELMYRITTATIDKVRKTLSYRIGHYILWPLKAGKKAIAYFK